MNEQPKTFEEALAARRREPHLHDWSQPVPDTERGVPILKRYCLTTGCWWQKVSFETAGQVRHD